MRVRRHGIYLEDKYLVIETCKCFAASFLMLFFHHREDLRADERGVESTPHKGSNPSLFPFNAVLYTLVI